MDQWSGGTSSFSQQSYGQQGVQQQQQYSYSQQSQQNQLQSQSQIQQQSQLQQPAGTYTYQGTSYGQQQAAAAAAAASGAGGATGAYGQQSYSQTSYGQQPTFAQQLQAATTGGSQQGGYANIATATYGSAAIAQSQAGGGQTASWAQQQSSTANTSQSEGGAAYGRSSGSGTSNVQGQYGGQYGSVYGSAAGQAGSQQVTTNSDFAPTVRNAPFESSDRSSQGPATSAYGGASSGVYAADQFGTAGGQSSFSKLGDQYGAGFTAKGSDYQGGSAQHDRGSYSQAGFGQDGSSRYQDTVVQRQEQQQDSQLYRQQQALQQAQQTAAQMRTAAGQSAAAGATRALSQQDYTSRTSVSAADYSVRAQAAPTPVYTQAVQSSRSVGFPPGTVYGAVAAAQQQAAQYAVATRSVGAALVQQAAALSAAGRGFGTIAFSQQQQQQQQQSGFGAATAAFGAMGGRDYSSGRLGGGTVLRDSGFSAPRASERNVTARNFDDRRDDRSSHRRDSDRGREDDRRRERFEPREKDRHQERDRDRDRSRDDDRRRDKGDGRESRDRKDEGSGRRDDRSKGDYSPAQKRETRHSSPRDYRRPYLCKIEPYSFIEPVRDYQATCRRYPKLYIVPEFTKAVACWVGKDLHIPLDKPISFEHEAVDVEDDPDSKDASSKSSDKSVAPTRGATTWNAKVLLMSGIDDTAFSELEGDKATEEKPLHFHNLVKFMTLRKDRNPIMAAGGVWDPELDGGNPETDESALIRTVIRCTKEATQIDLSGCIHWNRFLEVHYERMGDENATPYREITVFFVPDIWDIVPSLEEWKKSWRDHLVAKKTAEAGAAKDKGDKPAAVSEDSEKLEETTNSVDVKADDHDKKDAADGDSKVETGNGKDVLPVIEKEPSCPGVLVVTKRSSSGKMRSMSISLDGLLDYDEDDREEHTFELSLFAENMHEYLQHQAGRQILESIKLVRQNGLARKEEKKNVERVEKGKRELDDSDAAAARKKSKFSDTPELPKEESLPSENGSAVPEVKQEEGAEQGVKESGEKEVADDEGKSGPESAAKDEDLAVPKEEEPLTVGEPSDTGNGISGTPEKTSETASEKTPEKTSETASEKTPEVSTSVKHEKVETKLVVDRPLLRAYRYFDRNRVNYLKAEDVRRLLHCLGLHLSHKNVKDLASWAVSESGKARDDRIHYRSYTDKEVTVESG